MESAMLTMHVPGQNVTALIIFSINVFLNILVRVIKKTNKLFLWEIKWRSRMSNMLALFSSLHLAILKFFLQPWKLLRILQNNDAIKYISHYKKYGRTGLWTNRYMDEMVYGLHFVLDQQLTETVTPLRHRHIILIPNQSVVVLNP
jgi:hypothetical protein